MLQLRATDTGARAVAASKDRLHQAAAAHVHVPRGALVVHTQQTQSTQRPPSMQQRMQCARPSQRRGSGPTSLAGNGSAAHAHYFPLCSSESAEMRQRPRKRLMAHRRRGNAKPQHAAVESKWGKQESHCQSRCLTTTRSSTASERSRLHNRKHVQCKALR